VGAASSRDHLISRLEAAPTTNTTCSFQITGFFYFKVQMMLLFVNAQRNMITAE